MKRICQLLGMTVVLSLGLQSCSSSDDDVDLGEAKQVINMLSEPIPINLTTEQRTFAYDNNQFALNFLNTVLLKNMQDGGLRQIILRRTAIFLA